MKLNAINTLSDFESDRPETVVLTLQDSLTPDLYHFLYLTPQEIQQIVKIDKQVRDTEIRSQL